MVFFVATARARHYFHKFIGLKNCYIASYFCCSGYCGESHGHTLPYPGYATDSHHYPCINYSTIIYYTQKQHIRAFIERNSSHTQHGPH